MKYIQEKIKNIKAHGKGCFCDVYRLEGYCEGKGYKLKRTVEHTIPVLTHIAVIEPKTNKVIDSCYCNINLIR